MANGDRTVFGGSGGSNSDGVVFDTAAGGARVALGAPGKITLNTGAWDHAAWDDYSNVVVTNATATFGAFDVDNEDATFYFTESGLYLFEASATFQGSGTRVQRFTRISVGNTYTTPFGPADAASDLGGGVLQSLVRIAAVLPATENASVAVEFFSQGVDDVTGVTLQIRRLLAGAWE